MAIYTDFISPNGEAIQMNTKLDPTTDYHWVVTDRAGGKHFKRFTTDEDGYWSILKEDLPDGFFTHGQSFRISVVNNLEELESPKYMIVQVPFTEVHVTVRQVEGEEKLFVGGKYD